MQSSAHFPADQWLNRLRSGTTNNPGGNGYLAVVTDAGPAGDRYRRPREIFNSREAHGEAGGVFKKHLEAMAYADRWLDAKIAQLRRIHELRLQRGLELSNRLHELAVERGHLERDRKKLGTDLKVNEEKQHALIDEAREPEVEIQITPKGRTWQLYDAPSHSDGTVDMNHRQLVLEGTGLEGPEPAVEEESEPPPEPPVALHPVEDAPDYPDPPAMELRNEEGGKLPSSIKGKDGSRVRLGSWVEVLVGDRVAGQGFMVDVSHHLKGGAQSVVVWRFDYTDDDGLVQGKPSHVASYQVQKAKKPRGLKCPEWSEAEADKLETAQAVVDVVSDDPGVDAELGDEPGTVTMTSTDGEDLRGKPEQALEDADRPGMDPSKVRWPEDEAANDDQGEQPEEEPEV